MLCDVTRGETIVQTDLFTEWAGAVQGKGRALPSHNDRARGAMRNRVLCVLAGLLVAGLACSPQNPKFLEKPVTGNAKPSGSPGKPPGVPQPPPLPLPPPNLADVRGAVERVFAGDMVLDPASRRPYLLGDFNADHSEDVAVLLKPVPDRLHAINDPLSNWIIQDPHRAFIPPKNKDVVIMPPAPKREVIQGGDTLLGVIHGVGPAGFRNPIAIQTFVLCHAAGTGLGVGTPSASLESDFGALPAGQNVITDTIGGESGVLYWTGAGYAWHKETPVHTAWALTKKQPR
jgi:hypothetical protein